MLYSTQIRRKHLLGYKVVDYSNNLNGVFDELQISNPNFRCDFKHKISNLSGIYTVIGTQ